MGASKIIMAIQHDHESRVIIRRQLEDAGHVMISATSASQAISLLKTMNKPSLILISTNLPDMTADELAKNLRNIQECQGIPFAQIGHSEIKPPEEFCCVSEPEDLSAIIKWLAENIAVDS